MNLLNLTKYLLLIGISFFIFQPQVLATKTPQCVGKFYSIGQSHTSTIPLTTTFENDHAVRQEGELKDKLFFATWYKQDSYMTLRIIDKENDRFGITTKAYLTEKMPITLSLVNETVTYTVECNQ